MTNTQEKVNAIRESIEDLRATLNEQVKILFKEATEELFNSHPTLITFSWRQYTPYFNDGDECTFNVYRYYQILFSDYDEVYEEVSQWRADYEETEWHNLAHKEAAKAVVDFMDNFEDDELKEMFGDHVEVVVGRGGATVDEYSHD